MRIWVARPEPGAARTARRLASAGHRPVVAPVLRIRDTGAPMPEGAFDALLLTSAQAARTLADPRCLRLRGVPVYAVGGRTAELAAAAGFAEVIDADADAAGLAALVRARLAPGARLLHVAGADRKAEPAASLVAHGFGVTTHVAYAAEPVPDLPPAIALALAAGALDGVLHYSRRSAEVALHLARSAGLAGAFGALKHYCLSADVAVPLEAAGVVAHFVPARPNEDDLLAGVVTVL